MTVLSSYSPVLLWSGKDAVFSHLTFKLIGLCFIFLYYQGEGYLKGVKLTVEILRSALYHNDECKVSLCFCLLIPHC